MKLPHRHLVGFVVSMAAVSAPAAYAQNPYIVSWQHNLMGAVAESLSDVRQDSYGSGKTLTIKFIRGWDNLDARTREEKIQVITAYAVGQNCTLLKQGRVVDGNLLTGIAKCASGAD